MTRLDWRSTTKIHSYSIDTRSLQQSDLQETSSLLDGSRKKSGIVCLKAQQSGAQRSALKSVGNPRMIASYRDLFYVAPPLRQHPHRSDSTDKDRARQPSSPFGRTKDQPFAEKVRKGDSIGAECQLINLRIVDVVCSIESNYAGKGSPGAKSASAELVDWACVLVGLVGLASVDLFRTSERAIALDCVADGHDGDLSDVNMRVSRDMMG